jgi:hypothetical protein
MAELRHEHLGAGPPPARPTVREQLHIAYLAAVDHDDVA